MAAAIILILVSFGCVVAEESFVRLIITGGLKGAIKECKCPNGQPGGLARRRTIIQRLTAEYPEQTIALDCGRLTRDGMEPTEAVLLGELIHQMPYRYLNCNLIDYHQLFFPGGNFSNDLSKIPPYVIAAKCTARQNYLRIYDIEKWNEIGVLLLLDEGSPFQYAFRDSLLEKVFLQRTSSFEFYSRREEDKFALQIHFSAQTAWFDQEIINDTILDSLSRFYHTSPQRGTDPYPKSFDSECLTVNIRNLQDTDDFLEPAQDLLAGGADLTNLDVAIFGGGGYLEPEVFTVNQVIAAHPDDFGSYVLVLDIWSKDGKSVSRFEWEAIPSNSAEPDSSFQRRIDEVYDLMNHKKP